MNLLAQWLIPKGRSAESRIRFLGPGLKPVHVLKTYDLNSGCVRWLNSVLAKWYPESQGLPVAQHEFAALALLSGWGIAPKPVELRANAIVMEFAGVPVTEAKSIDPSSYREQCRLILQTLARLDFRHNDLLPRNVLINEGKVKLIDFTLSEFGAARFIRDLPNLQWARAGQDSALLEYC